MPFQFILPAPPIAPTEAINTTTDFARFFVANYCPLLFLEESGRNLPLDKLASDEQRAIAVLCDEALRATVRALAPRCVLGIGRFAERRAGIALADRRGNFRRAVEVGTESGDRPGRAGRSAGTDEVRAGTR